MTASAQHILTGRCIWLTRPAGQNAELAQRLERWGATVVQLPLLEIRPRTPNPAARQRLIDLDRYALVFYVSTNAARIGLQAIAQWWPQYPAQLRNFAVGPGTAAILEAQGLSVCYPRERMTSEALLALPELQDIAGLKALIVRGVGGREVMAAGLRARGATVDYVELYERGLPTHDPDWLLQCLTRQVPDVVVVSSGEALDNLKILLAPHTAAWQQLPLLLSSPRLVEQAQQCGFLRCQAMAGADDASIISGLHDWCATLE